MDDTSYFYEINIPLSVTTCAVNGSCDLPKAIVFSRMFDYSLRT